MALWTLVAACLGNLWQCQLQVIAVKIIRMQLARLINSKIVMKLMLGRGKERTAQNLRFEHSLLRFSLDHQGQADTMKMDKVSSRLEAGKFLLEAQEWLQVAKVAPHHAVISARIVLNSKPHI